MGAGQTGWPAEGRSSDLLSGEVDRPTCRHSGEAEELVADVDAGGGRVQVAGSGRRRRLVERPRAGRRRQSAATQLLPVEVDVGQARRGRYLGRLQRHLGRAGWRTCRHTAEGALSGRAGRQQRRHSAAPRRPPYYAASRLHE